MRQVSGAAACNTMRAQEDCNLPWDSNDDMNDCHGLDGIYVNSKGKNGDLVAPDQRLSLSE